MPKYYWIGSTLNTSSKLDAFDWNNAANWREEYIPAGTALVAIVKNSAPTLPPARTVTGSIEAADNVYIGIPLKDQNGNPVHVRSPLLFGGCTGSISPDSANQGTTWEHGAITAGVFLHIAGGTFFQEGYKFPVIGGGITGGGQGYWNSFTEFKNWAIEYYNLTNTNDINTIFSASQINTNPNLNQLKVKAYRVTETAEPANGSQLLVSMQIPRTWVRGTTLASTEYIRKGKNIRTTLHNSVINKISNVASRHAQTDPDTGEILDPVFVNNNLLLNNSVVNRYEGYYEDSVNIRSNCRLTSAEIFSPVAPAANPTNYYADSLFNIRLAGRYGAYYTSAILGLTGVGPVDGQIILGDTRKQEYGDVYQSSFNVVLGEATTSGATASYMKRLEATNSTVLFTGKIIVERFVSNNVYTAYKSDLAQYATDTVNIVYFDMKNQSTLDLTVTPQFDRWFFGKLPSGSTLVQGGIFAHGEGNRLYGSPGTAFYNDVLLGTSEINSRQGKRPQINEQLSNTSATSPQQNTQLA